MPSFTMDYRRRKSVNPEFTNKIHYHPFHELVIIDKGLVTYATDNGIIKVGEKSIVFMPAQTLHNPFVQGTHTYERYKIRFDSDFAEDMLKNCSLLEEALTKPYIKHLTQEDFNEIYLIAKSLYNITIKPAKTELDTLSEALHLSMLILKGSNASAIQTAPNSSYITQVITYIKENYDTHLTIQSLADHFLISRSKLIYDFRDYCRINIPEYITMTRIEAAKKHLLEGWSVNATAEACGFSTTSYFIKVFSQITGFTPLKFQMKYMRL